MIRVKSPQISLAGVLRTDCRGERWGRETSYGTIGIIWVRDGAVDGIKVIGCDGDDSVSWIAPYLLCMGRRVMCEIP